MSKNETPLIRKYWSTVGGTLIEEFLAVRRGNRTGQRLIDAIIIPDGETKVTHWKDVCVEGMDIICVQAKNRRLGMYLMGQTFFSEQLMKPFKPKSILSVALCTDDDIVLRPLLEQYPNMKVVIVEPDW